MKLNTLILTLALSLLSCSAAHAAAPVNDSITKAVNFQGPYQVVTTPDISTATAATTDPLINGSSAGKTIWYKITKSEGDTPQWRLSVKSLTGAGYVGIYRAADVDNAATSLTEAKSPAVIAAGQTVSQYVYAGITPMFLMISGSGTFEITHHLSPGFGSGGNDFPMTADDLGSSLPSSFTGSNVLATVTADEPSLPVSVANTVWYTWSPTFTGPAAVDTNFSFVGGDSGAAAYEQQVHDTVVAVYVGAPGSLSLVAWDDDGGWDTNSRVSFTALTGATYYISVSTKAGTPPGKFYLRNYRANTPGVLAFSPSMNNEVSETDGAKYVRVRRHFASATTASVQLTTPGGSATAGSDYTVLNTTLNFAASGDDAWEQQATIPIIDDFVDETFESVNLLLSNPSSGATISEPAALFYITDNESMRAAHGSAFALQSKVVRVRESAGSSVVINALLRATVGGPGFTAVQSVIGGTAEPDRDLTVSPSYFNPFANRIDLEASIKDDTVFEPEETVTIEVTSPVVNGYFKDLTYTLIIEDDDPYIPIAGKLVSPLDYGSRRGEMFATISATGALSGKLMLVGQTLPFKGQLDVRGKAVIPLAPASRAGGPGMMLVIQATDAKGGFGLALYDGLTNGVSTPVAVLQNYAAVTNPCPEAGRYTFVTESLGNVSSSCAGSIVVSVAGNAVVSGRLFDGTAYACAGYVGGDALMSAMSGLYANTGNIGFTSFLPLSVGQISGINARIVRPARAGDATKFGAANSFVNGVVCRYTPPASGQRALDCWSGGSGKATLNGGPLMNTLTKALTISPTNVVTAPVDAEKLKLTLVPSTGLFSGSFVQPGSSPAKTLAIYGALIDLPTTNGYGYGFFFDGLLGGKIVIGKP